MKRFFLFITTIALFYSCSDSTDGIGYSLVWDTNQDISAEAAIFDVASNSVKASDVVSRSATGFLGKVKDPETKSYITCNLMTQLRGNGVNGLPYPSEMNPFTSEDEIVADSCELRVHFGTLYGDSLAVMKVVAHELDTPLSENYSYSALEVDDSARTHIRTEKGSVHSQNSYTYSNRIYNSSQRQYDYYKCTTISLNDPYISKPYTHKNGEYKSDVVNNYGTYLLRRIYFNRDNASNDYWFVKNACPGFYIETVGGVGNLSSVKYTQLIVYFTGKLDTTAVSATISFGGTEEVLQKTAILQDLDAVDGMLKDTCTYLKTPASIFTQLTIPVDSILKDHRTDTLNTTRIFIPRINNNTVSDYNLPTPSNVLLLPTDSVESFFANKKVPDYKSAYLASYSSTYNGYTFGNIAPLVQIMDRGGNRENPNWNKVLIIPVESTTSTLSSGSSIITKVTYDMSLGSTRLRMGKEKDSPIKASVIYSHFK